MRLKTSKYSIHGGVQKIKTKTALGLSTLVLAVAGTGGMSVLTFGSAHAAPTLPTNEKGCSFVETPSNWTLQSDCSSTAEIYVPAGVTLDGSGYTISPTFTKTDDSNNAALGVLSNNVTIKNLTIDGVGGTKLHGINVYRATGVILNDVTLKNNRYSGLVVNGSNVTVNNIATMNDGRGGVNVDKGSVSAPAILTVNGTSTQAETAGFDIYVDNITSTYNSVVDTNSQYSVTYNVKSKVDAVYTLKTQAKGLCKDGGWATGLYAKQNFKNQGACVSYVASNGESQH